jgi:hypothetical protein
MHKLPVRSGLILAAVFAVAACGGSSTPTAPPVTVPSIAIPSIAIPSFAIPSIAFPSFALPSGLGGSFVIPSFVIPSFNTNADPALAAMFPQTIGGEPVTSLQTYSYAEFLALLASGDPTTAQAIQSTLTSAGADPTTLTLGTADAMVNNDDLNISAVHTPGVDATKILSIFPQLQQVSNPEASPPTVEQESIGGKSVAKVTDSTGGVTYAYPKNDVLWTFSASDDTEAATVLQALP